MIKAVEQHTVVPLQDAGGDNRFSALYALLDSEDTKPVHVSAPLPPSPPSSPDLGFHIFASLCTQEAPAAEATVTDLARRVSGDDALGAQKTYQSNKRARQKEALAVKMKARVGAATRIAVLWRGAKVRQAVAATRKMKAQRVEVGAVVAAAMAEQEHAATREVSQAAEQAQAEAQGEAHQQIWAVKDRSVRPNKIQIALSIYHSILAQAALRTVRMSTPHRHIVTTKSPTYAEPPDGKESPSAAPEPHSAPLARLHTLGTFPRHFPGPGSLAPFFSIQVPLSASPLYHAGREGGDGAP